MSGQAFISGFSYFYAVFAAQLTFMSESKKSVDNKSALLPDKKRIRLAVALVYFCMGLCFASWASRIPDIKTALHLNDAMLGSILFALPVGQFLMMPFSGKLVTHFGSRRVILFALPLLSLIHI